MKKPDKYTLIVLMLAIVAGAILISIGISLFKLL